MSFVSFFLGFEGLKVGGLQNRFGNLTGFWETCYSSCSYGIFHSKIIPSSRSTQHLHSAHQRHRLRTSCSASLSCVSFGSFPSPSVAEDNRCSSTATRLVIHVHVRKTGIGQDFHVLCRHAYHAVKGAEDEGGRGDGLGRSS